MIRPETVAVVVMPFAVVTLRFPGLDVTVYEAIALPPAFVGAVQLTVACALPAVALTPVGAPGVAEGVTALEGADAGPVPIALVAVTVKV